MSEKSDEITEHLPAVAPATEPANEVPTVDAQETEATSTPGVHGAVQAAPAESVSAAPVILSGDSTSSTLEPFQQVMLRLPRHDAERSDVACALYISGTPTIAQVRDMFDQNPSTFPPGVLFTMGERFKSRKYLEAYLEEHAVVKKDGVFHWWPPIVLPSVTP